MSTTVANPKFGNTRFQQRVPRPSPLAFSFLDWVTFFAGMLCGFKFEFGGEFPGGEILLLLLAPFLLSKYSKQAFRPENRTLYILLAIWLFSQVLSDVVNGSTTANAIKGSARVIVFGLDFAMFSILVNRDNRRAVILVIGLLINEIITWYKSPYGPGTTAWKYGEAFVVTMVLLLIGSYLYVRRRYAFYTFIVLALALKNLHEGFRSQIAVNLVALVFTLPFFSQRTASGGSKLNLARATILLACCGCALWLSQKAVHYGMEHGYFDEAVQQKFETQSSGKLGVLVGGRPEIPVSLTAIADRPFFGHGSYAIDPKYTVLLSEYQYKYGYSDSDEPNNVNNDEIPTHSHIFTFWVEGGFLASWFWFYTCWLIIRAMIKIAEERPPLAPLYAYFFVAFFWDIWFSPYGSVRRVYESFFLVLILNLTSVPGVRPPSPLKLFRLKRIFKPVRQKRTYRATPGHIAYPRLPKPTGGRRFFSFGLARNCS